MIRSHLHRIIQIGAVLLVGAALGLIAACGGGDSTSTPVAPAPPPPPPAPSVQSLAITTGPSDPLGYLAGETIGVQVTFSEAVTVSGTPLLKLGIGEELRDAVWDQDASGGASAVFGYVVTREDHDTNGISIGADALAAGDGAIRNAAGVAADLDLGDHAINDDGAHPVRGSPPEACGDQRSLALQHDAQFDRRWGGGMVSEWDGTPLRVDIVRNFPDFVTEANLWELLAPIGRLEAQIEAQLGYRIVEMGEPIEVPDGAQPGWDQDLDFYWRNDGNNDLLPRERGQMLVFYMNDNNDGWGGGGSSMSAHVCCGTTSYNKRALGPMWTGDDPCCQGDANQYTREGAAIVHEVFHLLGFKHAIDQEHLIGVRMSFGALDLPWESGSPVYYATPADIDNLRCIFPEGG